MFSPSLPCKASPIYRGLLPLTTMASADFSICITYSSRSPQVRTYSFIRFLRHLPFRDCWSRASQRCACLPSLIGLCMPFLFVSTGFCSLASFNVYLTVNHDFTKVKCDLLTGFTNLPVRDLHPLE